MKKFIFKTSLFTVPFFLLFLFNRYFYIINQGDLLRLGHLVTADGYSKEAIYKQEYKRKIKYKRLSEIDRSKKHHFNILVVGDSFSELANYGYQDYLVEQSGFSLLQYDRYLHDNPIQTVYGLLNGDVLDNIKVDYIVLQSVERALVARGQEINKQTTITLDSLNNIFRNRKEPKISFGTEDEDPFFSRTNFITPAYNILYKFDDNAFNSQTYKVKINRHLFSSDVDQLLFYSDDLIGVEYNNDEKRISVLNDELNTLSTRLKEKGIKLIVLPAPDKFDAYYDYIVDKNLYPKPIFFDVFDKLPKNYICIKTKERLLEAINTKMDIYYYDDTHWSPWASQIIASLLLQELQSDSLKPTSVNQH